jgi:demethylmenaquinone methyltransferase/2-methoxy-6-polyprenyl-1,4-benzoquinol methylase
VRLYYDRRASEYDDVYLGTGRFAERERPGWDEELIELQDALAALPPSRVLDVACGTGFLTRHLRGEVVALDQSEAMLEVARERCPSATFVRGDALELPFADDSFDRVFTGHFYGHLHEPERQTFLAGARRVGRELVVVDSVRRPGVEPAGVQERVLDDGSRYTVFKRYFTADGLLRELGGGTALYEGRWFLAVQA